MTAYHLAASCMPEVRAERAHLSGLLPAGALAAELASSPRVLAGDVFGAGGGDLLSCAVLAWARSGLMQLTGWPDGPPLASPAPVMTRAAVIVACIEELAARGPGGIGLSASGVLADRAALGGLSRRGAVSANGTCRLVRAADDWLAVSLARPTDVESLPAALGRDLPGDPWDELRAYAASCPAAELAAAAQLVGIPAAVLGGEAPAALRFSRLGQAGNAPRLVLDLSAMWAGPLCARILHRAGWRVLKVEDPGRPDGARSGSRRFYRSLHSGIPTVRLDFSSAAGRSELARLASQAGVIVESSRPRALRRLGLVAEDWLGAAPGRIWISVTGYGREDPWQRAAFGDDAAVAGGLVACDPDGTPVFCGDAIADPLTGLHAGLAALAARVTGGGWLADASMAGTCSDLIRPSTGPVISHEIRPTRQGWAVRHGDTSVLVS
jgi:crotonobetainyl-CoA:carnitine CoA-transferase CaiB-like acyl-CoA transferase